MLSNAVIDLGTKPETKISIILPSSFTKIWNRKRGIELHAPFDWRGHATQTEIALAGFVTACALRLRAFQTAGIEDPIPYSVIPNTFDLNPFRCLLCIMNPAEILRNILKLFQLLSRGFKSRFLAYPPEKSKNQPIANRPIPIAIGTYVRIVNSIFRMVRAYVITAINLSVWDLISQHYTIIVSVAAVSMSVTLSIWLLHKLG